MEQFNKHWFRLKGNKAEEALNELAFKSFLKEWCYPNPRREDGKEICDLLILFDNQLTIIQVKDIKFSGNDNRYIRKAFDQPCKQILGAERTLFELQKPIILKNPFGHIHQFDPTIVKQVYRLVVSVGDGNVPFNAIRNLGGKTIHVFDRSIEILLNELDTISDFNKYITDKERLLLRNESISLTAFREVDLLGDYIFHGKSFNHLSELDFVHYDYGIWEEVIHKPEHQAKQSADKISYFWDHIIEFAHECPEEEYREIAQVLSRLNRFERRCASETFFDAHSKAENRDLDFRRVWEMNGVTYVYLFTPVDTPRKQRVSQLQSICTVARNLHLHNAEVIGIATEIGIDIPHSYDYFYMNFPHWSKENQLLAKEIQEKYQILTNINLSAGTIQEYPTTHSLPSHDLIHSDLSKRNFSKKKIGRNDSCPCGSGKKYKRCHGR